MLTSSFAAAVASRPQTVTLDLARLSAVDAGFLGLLLMLRKQLQAQGARRELTGASKRLERMFRFHGIEFLLSDQGV